MQKQKLLLVIDDLRRGGAEMLLVGLLPDLTRQLDVILVTLSPAVDFSEKEIICTRKYTLGSGSRLTLLPAVSRLKKIIRQEKPDFVHAHLFFSGLVARTACPKGIPLFYSLHNDMNKNVFDGSRLWKFVEKRTVRSHHMPVAVSKYVSEDYRKTLDIPRRTFVLPNYVSDAFFLLSRPKDRPNEKKVLKLVAVGNIKRQKNYPYLLQAFERLRDYPVTLDIFGGGSNREACALENEIAIRKLPIVLKGSTDMLQDQLPEYDVFVSSSLFEGFGISVAEAMAAGLPLLLSDIPVFREVTDDNALFFDLDNPSSLANLISGIIDNKYDLSRLALRGAIIAKRFTKDIYLEQLGRMYASVLPENPLKLYPAYA